MIQKNTVNIQKLVSDIHSSEEAYRTGTWFTYAAERGLRKFGYVDHVTALYTLRAATRSKLHRLNPPQNIRDYNRYLLESGGVVREWDAAEHNRAIAEAMAPQYPRLEDSDLEAAE
jgi:hypothetical protein